MSHAKHVKWGDKEYILTEGGAIATPEDYEAFNESYAHLYEDGIIRRYGKEIGKKGDLEILRDYEGEGPSVDGAIRNLFGLEWAGIKNRLP